MVFAPTHATPLEPHEPTVTPRRPDHAGPLPASPHETRVRWRAVVHVLDRDSVHTTWHLAECQASQDPAAHCPEGQRLLTISGDPEGHCLVAGSCARCAAAA